MKLDQINRSRNFSKRLLNDFTKALMDFLQKKSLEEITVGELCAKANYPRSTFYNYFEDIYVLMDYCWETIAESMQITDFQSIRHDERTLVLFSRVYDYIDSHRDSIEKILKHNVADGAMLQSLDRCIRKLVYRMVMECPLSYKFPLSYDLVAQHYSNTVQMVLSACLLNDQISKTEASSYIDYLLGTLEKENTHE